LDLDKPRHKEPDTSRVWTSCWIRPGPRHSRLVWVNSSRKLPFMDALHTSYDVCRGRAFPMEPIWSYQGTSISAVLLCFYFFYFLFQ